MKPLAGCRVLDLGIITAGAATSAVLADLGADVIKVESPSYRDPFRRWTSALPADAPPDRPPFFAATNRNKRGLSLDLKQPAGREVFLQLVAHSDVVVENFRRGVLAKLGLDFATLAAVNPRLIVASISSQGESGPDSLAVSYGSTLEAVAGLAWTTGYADGAPTVSGVDLNYPDQVVALFAASMIVTAWQSHPRKAVHLDLAQRELTSFLLGDVFAAAGAGIDTARQGNAQAPWWLQDCFRCADGRWLAVSVADTQRAVLESLTGASSGAAATPQPAASSQAGAASLIAWCAQRPAVDALAALQAVRIASAIVATGREVLAQEGVLWRHALQRAPSGDIVKGFSLQFDADPLRIDRDAPSIGADSVAVLREVVGLDAARIDALRAAGVVEQHSPEHTDQTQEAQHVQ